MIMKIRTGSDSDGRDLFDYIDGIRRVDDYGEVCVSDEEGVERSIRLFERTERFPHPANTAFVAESNPRLLRVVFADDSKKLFQVLHAYLCNDQGATLQHFRVPVKVEDPTDDPIR